MFKVLDSGIKKADPFIYRINPENYIYLTENLLNDRNFFRDIDKVKMGRKNISLLNDKYSSLKKMNKESDDEKLFENLEIYKYFYKEVGASLKFNPLSNRQASVHVLETILEFLKKYIGLIQPKVVYTIINIEPDAEGLQVKGKDIHFNSKRLKIFTNHSSVKSEKDISPRKLVSENASVYVASIGPGIDNEVKSLTSKGNMFDAYLLNGIGAGSAEMVANDLNLFMNDNCGKQNCSYKRLSPGYGDWPVTDQEKIFKLLNPEINIGVKLTDSHIMLPEKSTSGIMGLINK